MKFKTTGLKGMALKRVSCASILVAFTGCSAVRDARLAPDEREQTQHATPPSLAVSPKYEAASVSADVAVPPDAFARWFERTGAPGFGFFLHGTGKVPGVTRTDPLAGGRHDPGDRRRLVFAHGTARPSRSWSGTPTTSVPIRGTSRPTLVATSPTVEDVTFSETPPQAPSTAPSGTRRHSTIGYLSPIEFEQRAALA